MRLPTCVGCERTISDQFILRVSPDLEWHAECLKCVDCSQKLDETCTCFVRNGKTYCRSDYISRFTAKCASCSVAFQRSDLVMKARDRIYHVDCFRCSVCEQQLTSGDEFALTSDDLLCCKADLDVLVGSGTRCIADDADDDVMSSRTGSAKPFNNNNNDELKMTITAEGENSTNSSVLSSNTNNNNNSSTSAAAAATHVTTSSSGTGGGGGKSRSSRSHKSDQKTTRIRTVLNEKQLHTLRTCYGANPRPDALMKEQLVEMTGLSPRVIRVWFQNKRCKDKKRSILLKQIQQHHQDAGVSMVAMSPVQHDPQSGLGPIKVHQYQLLPWTAFLPDHRHQSPLPLCPNQPGYPLHNPGHPDLDQAPFQNLLNSFQLSDDDEDDTVVSLEEPNGGRVAATGGGRAMLGPAALDPSIYQRQTLQGSGNSELIGGLASQFAVTGHQGVRC